MENEKCFCHLTVKGERYQVKDATARQGVEDINKRLTVPSGAGTVPVRDSENRINIGYPVEGNHGANKFYVDDQLNALKNEILADLEGVY